MSFILPDCYGYQVYTNECSKQVLQNTTLLLILFLVLGLLYWSFWMRKKGEKIGEKKND